MFMLNNAPLPIDTPFTTADGTQYPANWLRLSTPEEKAAIGITEVADPVRADDRFYWAGDINNPKALEDVNAVDEQGQPVLDTNGNQVVTRGLKHTMTQQLKATSYSLLAATDYKLVRKVETGEAVDQATLDYRSAVRTAYQAGVAAVAAATTVEQLIAAMNSQAWPEPM